MMMVVGSTLSAIGGYDNKNTVILSAAAPANAGGLLDGLVRAVSFRSFFFLSVPASES